MSPLRTKEQNVSIDFLGLNDMYKASISNFLKPDIVDVRPGLPGRPGGAGG